MNNSFCVYEHIFPDGKRYIGITSDVKRRWRNGFGYSTQKKVYEAIKKYGWDNVEHHVIVDGLKKAEAEKLERYLIKELKTITNGYNNCVGGNDIAGTYLNPRLLDFCRAAIRYGCKVCPVQFGDGSVISMPDFCYNARYDAELSAWWNEAFRAVETKHGENTSYGMDTVFPFWWYMREYLKLDLAIKRGEDVTGWKEAPYGWGYLFDDIERAVTEE